MKRKVLAFTLLLMLLVAITLVIKARFAPPLTELTISNGSNQTLTVCLGPDPLGKPIAPGSTHTAPFVRGMSVRIWVGPKAEGLPGEWLIDDVKGPIQIKVDGAAVELSASGLQSRIVAGS